MRIAISLLSLGVTGAIIATTLFRTSASQRVISDQGKILSSTFSAMLGDPEAERARREEDEAIKWLEDRAYRDPEPSPHGSIWGGFIRW